MVVTYIIAGSLIFSVVFYLLKKNIGINWRSMSFLLFYASIFVLVSILMFDSAKGDTKKMSIFLVALIVGLAIKVFFFIKKYQREKNSIIHSEIH